MLEDSFLRNEETVTYNPGRKGSELRVSEDEGLRTRNVYGKPRGERFSALSLRANK